MLNCDWRMHVCKRGQTDLQDQILKRGQMFWRPLNLSILYNSVENMLFYNNKYFNIWKLQIFSQAISLCILILIKWKLSFAKIIKSSNKNIRNAVKVNYPEKEVLWRLWRLFFIFKPFHPMIYHSTDSLSRSNCIQW